jgi:1-acyl-sn-glycerol-3-phosphate acyltransferase
MIRIWRYPLVGHGDTRLYTFLRWLAIPFFGGVYRCRVHGAENLPQTGPVMVIMTHKAFWDPVIAGMIFDRPLRFMAKKELFVHGAAARFISSLGAFPIDRGAGDRAALTAALDMLERGEMLLMFPEGHRQRYHGVGDFLPGVGMIALRSGAPVVPLALDGTQDMLRDGKLGLPALRGLVGPPVDLSDITNRNSKAYQEAAQRMHDAVAELYARL